MTRKQIILKLLIEASMWDKDPRNKRWRLYKNHLTGEEKIISGGYRPMYYFRGPEKGGDAADVRLRELRREHLVPIKNKPHHWQYWDPTSKRTLRKSTPIYHLAMTPKEIELYPWDPAWEEPFTWEFDRGLYQAIKDRFNPPVNGNSKFKPVEIHQDQVGQISFG